MDIKEAVNLAKQGDKEGITFLYEKTYQKAYYIALKYLKNEHNAEDVLQDSYIKAFQNIGQLEDETKFEPWLGRIVATRSLNELKKKNPMLFSETENEDECDISDTFESDRIDISPELAIDQQETSRLIREMMANLSDEQRICITMFYMEEMSIKEIADSLGVSENTVKSRLNYGRNKIKDKVLELEKKGTKLYGLMPIAFFVVLFKKDALACEVAVPTASSVLSGLGAVNGASTATASIAATGATKMGLTIGGTVISAKTIIIAVTAVVVIASGVGAGVYVNSRSETEDISVNFETDQMSDNDGTDESLMLDSDDDMTVFTTEEYAEDEVVDEELGINSEDFADEEEAAEEEQGMVVDSTYAYIAGEYKSDKGNIIKISLSTEYDGEYPDGAIEGSAESIDFGYMYLEPTSINVYDIKTNWQDVNGTGYILTGCDGGDTVRLYKDGILVETFSIVKHYYS